MTDAFSSKGVELLETDQVPGSGKWSFDFEQSRQIEYKHCRPGWLSTSLALALGISAFTSGVDPWGESEHFQQPALSQTSESGTRLRRLISISEARRLSLEILAQAEAERLQLADEEARKGLAIEDL